MLIMKHVKSKKNLSENCSEKVLQKDNDCLEML